MFFLVKSLICIALVLMALGWPDVGARSPASEPRPRALAARAAHKPQIEESAREAALAGTDALISAARDRCLSNPRDCAALLQRLQGAEGERRQ